MSEITVSVLLDFQASLCLLSSMGRPSGVQANGKTLSAAIEGYKTRQRKTLRAAEEHFYRDVLADITVLQMQFNGPAQCALVFVEVLVCNEAELQLNGFVTRLEVQGSVTKAP
ncbi:hypothetical protein JTY93_23470 [Pseudomonas hygromyciniae]|uniref:Uncharacterized protein n=1 Tax=Pseudomonas hygromyciniae TaxID=2812000 RepID=A0ABX7JUU9_9PSED|nr:hypothetical protein [Pseudomonas hygromyciniae]QSB39151.1 hypothetical protein JTY93_23470 [Pseudomonas hygromyciniae]